MFPITIGLVIDLAIHLAICRWRDRAVHYVTVASWTHVYKSKGYMIEAIEDSEVVQVLKYGCKGGNIYM